MSNQAGSPVRLTLAVNPSDQVRDLLNGEVRANGIDITGLPYDVEEIFFRFTKFREWEVSELSFGKYCALLSRGDTSLVGLPVFLSRRFRHSDIFVRGDGPVDAPERLAGARIGFPEWTVTATIYQRALLEHEYGVKLDGVDWVQAGINEPGRIETLPVRLPSGVSVRSEPSASLNQLLVDGEIDAIIAPHPPEAYEDRSGRIVKLFSDSPAVERAYYQRTGIFPIMHLVALRRDVHEAYPWAAMNLVTAFTQAKDRSLGRIYDTTAPKTPLPWGPDRAREAEAIFGHDLWPYGIEANRTTIDAFLGYAYEQGVCDRLLAAEELFPESVQVSYLT